MNFQGFIFFDETWSIKKKWNVVFPAKKPQNGCFAENQDIRIITLLAFIEAGIPFFKTTKGEKYGEQDWITQQLGLRW